MSLKSLALIVVSVTLSAVAQIALKFGLVAAMEKPWRSSLGPVIREAEAGKARQNATAIFVARSL
jgi:hypothetical protein